MDPGRPAGSSFYHFFQEGTQSQTVRGVGYTAAVRAVGRQRGMCAPLVEWQQFLLEELFF